MVCKKINKRSCESSSRGTSVSQLLAGSTKPQDFVWEMYVNQALLAAVFAYTHQLYLSMKSQRHMKPCIKKLYVKQMTKKKIIHVYGVIISGWFS